MMSLATLLDRNKAFAATDAVAQNPQIPWLPHQLSYVITCIDSRTEPPFDSGRPDTAPPAVLEAAERSVAALTARRKETARHIAQRLGVTVVDDA